MTFNSLIPLKMKGYLIIIIILVNLVVGEKFVCPTQKILQSCACKENTQEIYCDFENLDRNMADFELMYGLEISTLTLTNTLLRTIPLSNARADNLMLVENHKLTDYSNLDTFEPKTIIIIRSQFNTNNLNLLLDSGELKQLEQLTIENCNGLTHLNQSFDNLISLVHLNLRGNQIESIDGSIFSKLGNLNTIDLRNNHIRLSHASLLFPGDSITRNIILKNNLITSIELVKSGIGSNSGWINVDLSSNKLEQLDVDPFKNICQKHSSAYLGENNFKCNSNQYNWFQALDCGNYLKNIYCINFAKNLIELTREDFRETMTTSGYTQSSEHTVSIKTMGTEETMKTMGTMDTMMTMDHNGTYGTMRTMGTEDDFITTRPPRWLFKRNA